MNKKSAADGLLLFLDEYLRKRNNKEIIGVPL